MYPLQAGGRDRLSVQRHSVPLLRTPHPCKRKTRACETGQSRMIITTARKPSPRTRTFCKRLGRFTGWEYLIRGKTGLEALSDEPFLLIGEYRGNPGSFTFFFKGTPVLSIHAAVSMDKETHPGEEPVIEGDSHLAFVLGKVTGFSSLPTGRRVIRISDRIEFIDNGVSYIVLKIISSRGEGIA